MKSGVNRFSSLRKQIQLERQNKVAGHPFLPMSLGEGFGVQNGESERCQAFVKLRELGFAETSLYGSDEEDKNKKVNTRIYSNIKHNLYLIPSNC